MVEGARAIAPALELVVADDEMANTDLMRQLRDSERYTVAQFAQAIGAVHYANFRRNRAAVDSGAEPGSPSWASSRDVGRARPPARTPASGWVSWAPA